MPSNVVYETRSLTVRALDNPWPRDTVRFVIDGDSYESQETMGWRKPRAAMLWGLIPARLSVLEAAARAMYLCDQRQSRRDSEVAMAHEAERAAIALREVDAVLGPRAEALVAAPRPRKENTK